MSEMVTLPAPKTGSHRVALNLRLTEAATTWLRERARAEGVGPGDLLTYALVRLWQVEIAGDKKPALLEEIYTWGTLAPGMIRQWVERSVSPRLRPHIAEARPVPLSQTLVRAPTREYVVFVIPDIAQTVTRIASFEDISTGDLATYALAMLSALEQYPPADPYAWSHETAQLLRARASVNAPRAIHRWVEDQLATPGRKHRLHAPRGRSLSPVGKTSVQAEVSD